MPRRYIRGKPLAMQWVERKASEQAWLVPLPPLPRPSRVVMGGSLARAVGLWGKLLGRGHGAGSPVCQAPLGRAAPERGAARHLARRGRCLVEATSRASPSSRASSIRPRKLTLETVCPALILARTVSLSLTSAPEWPGLGCKPGACDEAVRGAAAPRRGIRTGGQGGRQDRAGRGALRAPRALLAAVQGDRAKKPSVPSC